MNQLKLRTLLITALALGAAQASLAAGGGSAYEPPSGRNGWQPAATTKALPQTAAVRAPAGGVNEPPSGRNGWQPAATTKTLPLSAKAQPQVRTASGR